MNNYVHLIHTPGRRSNRMKTILQLNTSLNGPTGLS